MIRLALLGIHSIRFCLMDLSVLVMTHKFCYWVKEAEFLKNFLQDDRNLVWMYPKSHERFRLKLINAEYASNSVELKVAAIYMIDFKTSSKMTENLLNRGNWKCWIFIDTRCKMPPWLWRITAFKLFFYKSWENDTLPLIHFFYPSLSAQDICYLVFPYVLCHHVCDWNVTSNHYWKCILHVTH